MNKSNHKAAPEPKTVAELARAKGLPEKSLRDHGIEDQPGGGISIPYYDMSGGEMFRRRRGVPGDAQRFRQPAGVPLSPYGLWRLADLGAEGVLHIAEGETDALTLWHHGYDALGLPGSGAARSLEAAHLAGVSELYVLPDNDAAGKAFADGVARRLAELGYAGRASVVSLPDGAKDVNDLYRRPGEFRDNLERLKRMATPLNERSSRDNAKLTYSKKTEGAPPPERRRYVPLPEYRPFPVEALPPVVRELVEAAAAAIGCDPALVALPALATVAGAIGNSRAVVLKKGWAEPSCLWAATVAESGSHKSPAFAAATKPLLSIQFDLYDEFQAAMLAHNNAVSKRASMPKAEREATEGPEPPEKPPTFVTSDTTIEALGELMRDSPRGVLVARDELDGWFQSFVRYKGKGGGNDRAAWLELHRAGELIVERLTRSQGRLAVRRALASVVGTIQPGVLSRALDRDALQAGLGAWFLLAMPPPRKRRWTEAELADDVAERYEKLLRSLLNLQLANPSKRKPHYLGLSLQAKARWLSFFEEWSDAQQTAEGEIRAAFSKLEAYATRLALVHHVVTVAASDEGGTPAVREGSMEAGILLAKWFAREAERIYMMLSEGETERDTRRLVEHIQQLGGRVTPRMLQRANCRRWRTSEAARGDLDELVRSGLARWETGAAGPQGGRVAEWCVLTCTTHDTTDTTPLHAVEDVEVP
jgi:hypothetical protein